MKPTRGRFVAVDSLAELNRRLTAGTRDLTGWRLIGLDLRGYADVLARCATGRTTFAGCDLDPEVAAEHTRRGALILPNVANAPVDVHRSSLYTAGELYDHDVYSRSLDGRAFAWQQTAQGPRSTMARALHDYSVDAALDQWSAGRALVGVMGGHAASRGEEAYDDAARLGHLLGRTFTVATGGGPGAMEAANLGARLSALGEDRLREALGTVATTPSYHPSVDAWAGAAREVLRDPAVAAAAGESLGIPTWHYGHEPPNLFATAIAKYFRNALREAILLQICNRGIVFLPGAGGTVQEIFQDACENYYATEETLAPMVLVGREYWTEQLPAWPLLRSLAAGRSMEAHIHLVDSVEAAAEVLIT
ncbi:LOG family protein [Zhihengliuella halotolerans]|uniref:LOG family protein n=1 Tax=Zhihengliuella halotolerans TaxID=370736 RepID=UPI000C7FD05A|nr:LOG family protein [Zhihengliuella halotolerans]